MYLKMHRVFEDEVNDGKGGGGAPTPAPAPVATPAPPPAPASEAPVTSSDVDELFSEIANEDLSGGGNEDELPVSIPKGAKPAAPPTAAPVSAAIPAPAPVVAAPVPAPTPPPPATPPIASAPPPAPTPPAEPPKPAAAAPTPTDEERKVAYAKERDAALVKLTERYATLSEEEVRQLTVEPEKVLPKLLAKVHAEAMDNMTNWVQQNLPTMLEGYQAQMTAAKSAGESFFTEWPELNKPELLPAVARILRGYRSANPDAKPEDVVREGGIAALVALKIPMPDRVMAKHNVAAPDATRPAAFPPVAGPGASTPPPQPSDNVFTVIAQEDLAES